MRGCCFTSVRRQTWLAGLVLASAVAASAQDRLSLANAIASPGQHNVSVGISATTVTILTGLDVDIDFPPALCSHLEDQELRLAGRTSSATAEVFLEAAACPQEGRVSLILMDLQGATVLTPGAGPIGEWTFSLRADAPVGEFPITLHINQARNGPLVVNMPTADAGLIVTRCTCDCDGKDTVTVDEIITAVNIALGSQMVAACRPADTSANDDVTVDEIISGVNNALNGCNP